VGANDYYASGQWNFTCDLCGQKQKSSRGRKTWNNLYVCAYHKEVRNPQDFVRGVKDNQSVPWSRTPGEDQFVLTCTLRGSNAIPGYAVPSCCFPSNVNLLFVEQALPQGPFVLAAPPPHPLNDLTYIFDAVPTTVVQVQSTVPGHTTEFFLKVTP
jgi:hypothetical protein